MFTFNNQISSFSLEAYKTVNLTNVGSSTRHNKQLESVSEGWSNQHNKPVACYGQPGNQTGSPLIQ